MDSIELPPTYPMYMAFGQQGNFIRKARTVGELPHSLSMAALKVAANRLGVKQIQYGVPVYRTLGFTRSELDKDSRHWLKHTGESLPLQLFWEECDIEEEA